MAWQLTPGGSTAGLALSTLFSPTAIPVKEMIGHSTGEVKGSAKEPSTQIRDSVGLLEPLLADNTPLNALPDSPEAVEASAFEI